MRERLPSLPSWRPGPRARMYSVLGFVVVAMTLAAAGVLSGLALFIISLLGMVTTEIIASSILLSVSSMILLLCYLWITG